MAELIDKKLVLKDIATWAVGGNPEEPEMVRMDELAMAMGVSVGRLPTTTEAEIRAMAYEMFSIEAVRQFIEFDEKHDFISIGVCLDIISKVAEQLKEE